MLIGSIAASHLFAHHGLMDDSLTVCDFTPEANLGVRGGYLRPPGIGNPYASLRAPAIEKTTARTSDSAPITRNGMKYSFHRFHTSASIEVVSSWSISPMAFSSAFLSFTE